MHSDVLDLFAPQINQPLKTSIQDSGAAEGQAHQMKLKLHKLMSKSFNFLQAIAGLLAKSQTRLRVPGFSMTDQHKTLKPTASPPSEIMQQNQNKIKTFFDVMSI